MGLMALGMIYPAFQPAPAAAEPGPGRYDSAVEVAAGMPRLNSLLISRGGELVLERYFNGYDGTRPVNLKSASKSVLSALTGIAIAEGHIAGVDQTLDAYFRAELGDAAGAKSGITIEDLLTMQSGLASTSNRNYGAWVLSPNWVQYVLDQPLESPPGLRMNYSTGSTHLLSAIITRATGRSTLEYARDVLAGPLGFHLPEWPRDPQGIYFGGNDMEMTPRQMLAFGELYLNGGRAGGRQIVPPGWVETSLRRHARSRRHHDRYYGYGWWIEQTAGFDTPYAWGYGGQFIVLVPDLDLVVVATSDSTPADNRRSHRRRLHEMIERHIIRPAAGSASEE